MNERHLGTAEAARRLMIFLIGILLVTAARAQENATPEEQAPPLQSWGSNYGTAEDDYDPWSFDQKIDPNPLDANPYLVNRNVISSSPPALLNGSISLNYERLISSTLAFVGGINFHHSNLSADFESVERNLSSNAYAVTAGAQLGFSVYTDKRYAQGFFLAVLLGGGLIFGRYSPDNDENNLVDLEDFYGGIVFRLGYRFVWQNFAITPTFGFGVNLVLYNEGTSIENPKKIPVYYTLHTTNDVFSRHSPFNLFGDETLLAYAFGGVGLEFSVIF